jgi:hypothetical protein
LRVVAGEEPASKGQKATTKYQFLLSISEYLLEIRPSSDFRHFGFHTLPGIP